MQHVKEVVLDKRLDDKFVQVMLRTKTEGKMLPNRSTTADGRLGLSRAAAILIDG